MRRDDQVALGFYAAGFTNIIGITVFSKAMMSETFETLDPVLFSDAGCLLIALWGLAYIGTARAWRVAPVLPLVFGLEKLFYGISWIQWLLSDRPPLAEIFAEDALSGLFYSVYGVIDLSYGAFFFLVYAMVLRDKARAPADPPPP